MRVRLRSLLFLAALCGAAAVAAQASGPVTVSAERNADLFQVRAQVVLHATLPVVWGTLTDYERLPEFIPGMLRSRVLARDGDRTTVEQSAQARFLFLTVPIEVTTEFSGQPPVLLVRRVGGPLRHLQGRYDTEVLGHAPPRVRLRWSGSIGLDLDLPPLIGEALVRQQFQEQFEGMVQEIERRARAAPPPGVRP